MYTEIAQYSTLYILIRKEYITFLLQTLVFFLNLILSPSTLVRDRAIWLPYPDSAMLQVQESPSVLRGTVFVPTCALLTRYSPTFREHRS